MLLKVAFFFTLLLKYAFSFVPGDNVQLLSGHFFDNLRAHPKLSEEFDENVKQFIDRQVDNFLEVMRYEDEVLVKRKRSLPDGPKKKSAGVHVLTEVVPADTIPIAFPQDINIFENGARLYVAGLESDNNEAPSQSLVIVTGQNGTYEEVARTSITNGVKIATISLDNGTSVIVVAENDTSRPNFHQKSAIYSFNQQTLKKIQTIDMHFASDVALWRVQDDIYMVVAHQEEIPIYKWRGRHFDVVQLIEIKGARKIEHFAIGHNDYLIVANFQHTSDIYKFDYHTERYLVHQRITTKGCKDIKFFTMAEDDVRKEHFLIVANSIDPSILYKYVDDYFIPMESFPIEDIEQWLPIQGPNKEAILFAFGRYQIQVFQYDGWSFQEIDPVIFILPQGIKSASTHINSLVISNANNKGDSPNVFSLQYVLNKEVEEIQASALAWCRNQLDQFDDYVLTKRADIVEDFTTNEDEWIATEDDISTKLEALSSTLDQIDQSTVLFNLTADEVIFGNDLFLDHLQVVTINNVSAADLLHGKLNNALGYEVEEMTIDLVELNESLINSINSFPALSLVRTSDDLTVDNLTVRGKLIADGGLSVERLNGIAIDQLLLIFGDQDIQEAHFDQLQIDHLQTRTINSVDLASVELWTKEKTQIDTIANLTVTNLVLGGYINDVDIPSLDKYCLKNVGNQVITQTYNFDSLEAQDLTATLISGQFVEELIPIDQGLYILNQNSIFVDNLSVNNLTVLNRLNNIQISGNGMDVLLKNSTDEQYISGNKVFNHVITTNPITIQSRINSTELEKINQVVTIDDDLIVTGDQIITGNVQVEDLLSAHDLTTYDCALSLKKVESDGLKLTDNQITPKLKFVQPLNVDNVTVDKINGINPKNYVVNGGDQVQRIRGWTVFEGDIFISGSSAALKVDDVDVRQLENDTLRVDGNQTIDGKHHIKRLIVKRIRGKFENNVLEGTTNQITITGNLKANKVKTNTIQVNGLIGTHNLTEVLEDVVNKTHTNVTILGHISVDNLTTDSIKINTTQMIQLDHMLDRLYLNGPVRFEIPPTIEKLHFSGFCNGINSTVFGTFDLNSNGVPVVRHNLNLERMTVHGKVLTGDGLLNKLKVQQLVDNTVKIDEPFEFDSGTFDTDVVSKMPIQLDGHVENLDLKYVIASNSTVPQTIFDDFTAADGITVTGSVQFDGLLNGLNLTELCQLAVGSKTPEELVIDGDVYFAKGPDVGDINDKSVRHIWKNVWLKNKPAVLSGTTQFANLTLEAPVLVQGFVENVSLPLLSKNYFSKRRDQNITSTLNFEDDVTIDRDLMAREITAGRVNDINLEEFVRTALIDDYDQTFESTVYLDRCTINGWDLQGEFLVNGLNLQSDVMHYDKSNMVTGKKTVVNLTINNLTIDKRIMVQEVDVLGWLKRAVLRTGTFNITAMKTFNNVTCAKGLRILGNLNGLKFNDRNVMLRNVAQNITGKTFQNWTNFKGIKLRGFLNGIDLSDLMNKQAYKTKDNTFKNTVNFNNTISTSNLMIATNFQGVNVSELIRNVSNLGQLNNLVDNYKKLEEAARVIDRSLHYQAYFVQYYKTVQKIGDVHGHVRVLCDNGMEKMAAIKRNMTGASIVLYGWQEDQLVEERTVYSAKQILFMDGVFMGKYLYVEEDDSNGRLIRLVTPEPVVFTMENNSTKFTTSFELAGGKEGPCTLFLYHGPYQARIFCEIGDQISLVQELQAYGACKATTLVIDNIPYIILAREAMQTMHSPITIYKMNATRYFDTHQILYEAEPKSLVGVSHNTHHFLAIASGRLQNAMYSGRVVLYKYDSSMGALKRCQTLELDAPIQVQFAVLPTGELMLYVVSENPMEPLIFYRYEGIVGFKRHTVASTLSKTMYVNQFVGAATDLEHFLIAQNYDETTIVRAIFLGGKIQRHDEIGK